MTHRTDVLEGSLLDDSDQRTPIIMAALAILNRLTWPEAWAIQKLVDWEIICHSWVRSWSASFPKRIFALVVLPHVTALVGCAILLLSRTTSLGEASAVCTRRFALVIPKLTSDQTEYWEIGSNAEIMPSKCEWQWRRRLACGCG
jgi:hypothetical protein